MKLRKCSHLRKTILISCTKHKTGVIRLGLLTATINFLYNHKSVIGCLCLSYFDLAISNFWTWLRSLGFKCDQWLKCVAYTEEVSVISISRDSQFQQFRLSK